MKMAAKMVTISIDKTLLQVLDVPDLLASALVQPPTVQTAARISVNNTPNLIIYII